MTSEGTSLRSIHKSGTVPSCSNRVWRNFFMSHSDLNILKNSEALKILTDLYLPISSKSLSPVTIKSADADTAQAMNLSSSASLHAPLILSVTSITSKKGRTSSSIITFISCVVRENFGDEGDY